MGVPAHAEQSLTFSCIDDPVASSSLEVLKVAYAKLGIRVDGIKLPAARALAQAEAGNTDGEVNRIKMSKVQHPQLLRIDIPINSVEGVALSCKPIDTTSVEAIRSYRVGIKRGILYAEKMTAGMPFVTRMTNEDMLMEVLLADRLDCFIIDRHWAEAQVKKYGRECLRVNEPPLVVIPLYHYLHKRYDALVPDITRVLRQMKETGESDRILRKSFAEFLGN